MAMVGVVDMPTYGLDRFETHIANWNQRAAKQVDYTGFAGFAGLGAQTCFQDDLGETFCEDDTPIGSGGGGGSTTIPTGYGTYPDNPVISTGAPAGCDPDNWGAFGVCIDPVTGVADWSKTPGGMSPANVAKAPAIVAAKRGAIVNFSFPGLTAPRGTGAGTGTGTGVRPSTTTQGQLIQGVPNSYLLLGAAAVFALVMTSR